MVPVAFQNDLKILKIYKFIFKNIFEMQWKLNESKN
jgi:hypothetical protein